MPNHQPEPRGPFPGGLAGGERRGCARRWMPCSGSTRYVAGRRLASTNGADRPRSASCAYETRCAPQETSFGTRTTTPSRAWRTQRRTPPSAPELTWGRRIEKPAKDVGKLAREHPALFFGGALVLGLAVGRVLKAGVSQRREVEAEPRVAAPRPSRERSS